MKNILRTYAWFLLFNVLAKDFFNTKWLVFQAKFICLDIFMNTKCKNSLWNRFSKTISFYLVFFSTYWTFYKTKFLLHIELFIKLKIWICETDIYVEYFGHKCTCHTSCEYSNCDSARDQVLIFRRILLRWCVNLLLCLAEIVRQVAIASVLGSLPITVCVCQTLLFCILHTRDALLY